MIEQDVFFTLKMNLPYVARRFVLMANDYPHQLLPADWTEMQAIHFCTRLREHEEQRQRAEYLKGTTSQHIYYHIKDTYETGELRPYK